MEPFNLSARRSRRRRCVCTSSSPTSKTPDNQRASATITGPGIKPEWQSANSLILYNPPDYHGDAVISGKVEIIPEPTPNWTELYPIILGPTYTYHPPTQ